MATNQQGEQLNPQGLTAQEMGPYAERNRQPNPSALAPAPSPTSQGPTYYDPVAGTMVAGDINQVRPWERYGLGSQAAYYNMDPATLRAMENRQGAQAQGAPAQGAQPLTNAQLSAQMMRQTAPAPSSPTPVPQNASTVTAAVGAADARNLDSDMSVREAGLAGEQARRIQELRDQQRQEEDLIRQTLQNRRAELGVQQGEDQKTQDVLAYRLGRKDTPYGVAEMSNLRNDQARVMNELVTEENRLVLQSRAALKKGEFDVATQMRDEADRMFQRRIQQEELAFRKRSQVMEEQKYVRDYGKDVFSALAEAGKEPSQELYDWYDETVGVQGIGQSIYGANVAERKRKDIKEAREAQKADLDAASSLINVLGKIPVGQEIKIGDNIYQGLDRGDVATGTETDAQGNVTFWEYDKNTRQVKRTSLGNIGKPQDGWTTVQTDQGMFSYNTKTKQYVPLQPGIAQSTWQKTFPDGTQSPFRSPDDPMQGQCGAFVNDLYGKRIIGNTYAEKESALKPYEVERGDVQVGDTFLQRIGTTGHIGIVSNVANGPDGKTILTFLESNAVPPGGLKISTTRTMSADDPRLTMFARVPTPNLPPAGTDSPATSAAVGLTVGGRPISEVIGGGTDLKNYVDALKSGGMKLDQMPQDIRADVLAQARAEGYSPQAPGSVQPNPLPDYKTFRNAYFETEGLNPNMSSEKHEAAAKQAYEQEKVFRTDLSRAIDTLSRGGKSKDQRAMFKEDMIELMNTGDYEALETALRSEAYNQLPTAQQQAFTEFDNAKESSAQAARFAEGLVGEFMAAGPYKSLVEGKKPFIGAKADPKYVQLFSLIELGQAQLRRGFYGTAVTETESATSKKFLVDPERDSIQTIQQKLNNQSKYLEFVNDATVAQKMGLKKPKLSDYIKE